VSLSEGLRLGIVDGKSGTVADATGRHVGLDEAVKAGLIVIADVPSSTTQRQRLISLQDAINSGLFDSTSGTILDSSTNLRVPFGEALGKIVDISGIEVRHPTTNELMSLEEAMSSGLVNPDTGYFNVASGSPISLQEAMMMGYVIGWMARELTVEANVAAAVSSVVESHVNTGAVEVSVNGTPVLPSGLTASSRATVKDSSGRGFIAETPQFKVKPVAWRIGHAAELGHWK